MSDSNTEQIEISTDEHTLKIWGEINVADIITINLAIRKFTASSAQTKSRIAQKISEAKHGSEQLLNAGLELLDFVAANIDEITGDINRYFKAKPNDPDPYTEFVIMPDSIIPKARLIGRFFKDNLDTSGNEIQQISLPEMKYQGS